MSDTARRVDVAVVGGGLAGLAAATFAARSGRSVMLFEGASAVGGRATTQDSSGFLFNLGPHALYRGGAAAHVLSELGVHFHGGVPAAAGGYAVDGGVKHALPGGFVSLVTTGLLAPAAKLETARLLAGFGRIDPGPLQGVSVRRFLDDRIRHAQVRRLVQALFRLSTYTNDPEQQSAGTAVEQLQLALAKNVLYLDGGWQTLVDGLREAATASGVEIVTSAGVAAIERDQAVRGVRLRDGRVVAAASAIVATEPATASALVASGPPSVLAEWARAAIPVKAACLDLALSRLPRSRASFALGVDEPLYFSVHSARARLSPEGTAVVHVAKYLPPGAAGNARADERRLEALADLVQPGWRQVVVERRFLPAMVVSGAMTTAAAGGTAGRPGPEVPDVRNLYVAGDWVGPEGLLADASLASARRAAALVAERRPAVPSAAA